MIQGTAKLNVMKSDIESELSVTDYISGFSVCDELAIKVKKRNKNTWSDVSSTRRSSFRDFIYIQMEDNEVFICTPDQRICTDTAGSCKRADRLVVSDSIVTVNDDKTKILKIYNMKSRSVENVYSLITCDSAPYYADDVLIMP